MADKLVYSSEQGDLRKTEKSPGRKKKKGGSGKNPSSIRVYPRTSAALFSLQPGTRNTKLGTSPPPRNYFFPETSPKP
jgi:hypothetical protein